MASACGGLAVDALGCSVDAGFLSIWTYFLICGLSRFHGLTRLGLKELVLSLRLMPRTLKRIQVVRQFRLKTWMLE